MDIPALSCSMELEVLLHYYSARSIMEPRSTAVCELEDRLIDHGLLEMFETMQTCNVRCTEKGTFFIEHLLTIQFPVEERRFRIPS